MQEMMCGKFYFSSGVFRNLQFGSLRKYLTYVSKWADFVPVYSSVYLSHGKKNLLLNSVRIRPYCILDLVYLFFRSLFLNLYFTLSCAPVTAVVMSKCCSFQFLPLGQIIRKLSNRWNGLSHTCYPLMSNNKL